MATKKKGGKAKATVKRAGAKVKKGYHRAREAPKPGAAMLGGAISAYKIANDSDTMNASPLLILINGQMEHSATKTTGIGQTLGQALSATVRNAKKMDNLIPAGVGVVTSMVGKKVPIVGKPADRMVKRLTKGKVGL